METHNPPRFINRCQYTKESLMALQKCRLPKAFSVFTVGLELLLLLFIISDIMEQKQGNLLAQSAVLILLLFSHLVLPHLRVRSTLNQTMQLYHRESVVEVSFFEDGIANRNLISDAKAELDYSQITMVTRVGHFYILRLKAHMAVLLDREGFLLGTPEQFEAFICQKAANAKIKW